MKSALLPVILGVSLILLGVFSCQHDDFPDPDGLPGPGNTNVERVNATITGRIIDDANNPVQSAAVKASNGAITTTDVNGNFRFKNISIDKNKSFVIAEKAGFFQGSRTLIVREGSTSYLSIQLIKKTVAGSVSGSAGGKVTVPSGGSIELPANGVVIAGANTAYTGAVSVSAFFLNPTEGNFEQIMPGALRGITTANEERGLQSFGMLAVELSGAGGEKLQLANGKTASLTFPIPTSLLGQAPATIPLWYFNDSTGLWKEQGSATKQGSNYVGTVSHFSYWNCDVPFSAVDFKVVVKDQSGSPVFKARVELKTTGDTTSSYGYGYTDSSGFSGGKIPANTTFKITITNKCNTVMYTSNIGPFSTNGDIGTLVINNVAPAQVTVSGSVVNCTASPVTNGFVDIAVDNEHYRALVTNGSFSIGFDRCTATPVTAVVTPFDLGANVTGAASNISVSSGAVATGQLTACGTTIPEFVNATINGSAVNYVPPADSVIMYKQGTETTLWATRRNNSSDQIYINFTATGTGTVTAGFVNIRNGNSDLVPNSAINLNITEYGPIGGYVAGNFSATLKDSANSGSPAPVNLSFRAKRTQ